MLHREQSKGWRAWVSMMEERAAYLQLLRKWLSKLGHSPLDVDFGGRVSAMKEESAMAKGHGHMRHREQTKGWRE